MIARFRAWLPFTLYLRQGDTLKPMEVKTDKLHLRIHPPGFVLIDESLLDPLSAVPFLSLPERLNQEENPAPSDQLKIDGAPTTPVNLLTIDFIAPHFDRGRAQKPGTPLAAADDPPLIQVFQEANNFLGRLRSVTQAKHIRPISARSTIWRIDYLSDDGRELAPDPAHYRKRLAVSFSWTLCAISEKVWTAARELPQNYRPAAWETLLLDAEALLPQVGPSIVLAFSALETFVESALNTLVSATAIPSALWEWIRERGGRADLTPSVSDQLDVLLKILTGKSLKGEEKLWTFYTHLKQARNSFLHEGVAVIGSAEVTPERAWELIEGVKQISDWLEKLIPPEHRRPRLADATQLQLTPPLLAPPRATVATPTNSAKTGEAEPAPKAQPQVAAEAATEQPELGAVPTPPPAPSGEP